MSTTTQIPTLTINYLTQAQYDAALANDEIDENQLYLTPPSITADYVTETGTDNSFTYRKWSDGRLEAERIWNIGQVTLSTTETSTTKVSGEITIPTPSIMTSGEVEVTYVGNSSTSATYLERVTRTSFRFAKNTTATVTLQGVTVVLRLVNGRWK